MKKLMILLACTALGAGAQAQPEVKRAATIDSILQVYTDKKMFCGSVLIAKGGKVLLSKGYGMANYSHRVPNKPNTKFKLASVSKQFTAMCIMMLQEKGKLLTSDKLSKYIPDYPKGDSVTIHQLLTHTSGIPDFTGMPLYDSIMTRPHTLDQMIGYFKNKPFDFQPGELHRYSNSGYILLTYIIEKTSGEKYGDFIRKNIFEPLAMKNSGLYDNRVILQEVAEGYSEGVDALEIAPYIDMSIPSGAGALYSTVEDLYLWDRALNTEKLVKKATIDKIFTPEKARYAYGWRVDDLAGHKWISHGGGIQGFSTVINRFPDDDMCIVILKNVDNQTFFPANKVARCVMFDQKYELPVERTVAKVDKEVYKTLLGEYELMPGFIMTISTEGDKLFAQATNQPRLQLFPEAEYKYFSKAVDAQMEFTKDEKGKISTLTLLQGGQKIPGKKIK